MVRIKKYVLAAVCAIVAVTICWIPFALAVGTNAITYSDNPTIQPEGYPVRSVSLAWTSDASGDVSGDLTVRIRGVILGVEFVPGAAGVQPTDLYDVTIEDENGVDVLAGQGANLSNATATVVCPGVPFTDGTTTSIVPRAVCDQLELIVDNAGNAKSGVVVVYYR